jgi:hypothetical protein
MSVNKIKIIRPTTNNYVDIPIEMKWDFAGHDDSILEYQKEMVKEIIGSPNDFEISRFSHNSNNVGETDINYEFYFYDNVSPITANTINQTNWGISYINEGFTNEEVYYYTKPFTKSFFKLDFYDTTDEKTQQIYFTIILPVQQGDSMSVNLNVLLPNVDIRKPKFKLDYINRKLLLVYPNQAPLELKKTSDGIYKNDYFNFEIKIKGKQLELIQSGETKTYDKK